MNIRPITFYDSYYCMVKGLDHRTWKTIKNVKNLKFHRSETVLVIIKWSRYYHKKGVVVDHMRRCVKINPRLGDTRYSVQFEDGCIRKFFSWQLAKTGKEVRKNVRKA